MWQNIKLSVFFSLMILANLAMAEETTTYQSLVIDENYSGDHNLIIEDIKDGLVSATESIVSANGENLDQIMETQTIETDSKLSTDGDHVTEESVTEPTTLSPTTTPNVESPNETETGNEKIDCVCNCTANGGQVKLECSTQVPDETQTEASTQTENNDTENTEESTTSSNENPETATDSQTSDDTTTASVITESPETTSESNTMPETTTISMPPCSMPGVQPHESDCKQYYDCTSEGFSDGSFHLLSKSCPDKQVFNNVLNRCSRDISSCSNTIECLVKGGVADPASNKSYYLCEPRLIGGGFHVFHIECSENEIFYPELGKCFVDFNNLPSQIYPPYNWNKIEDIDIVKAEMKLLKAQYKLKLKQEKEKLKAEEKLRKQLEKDAKQQAKDEAKANKEKAKAESATFVCTEEGNFESTVSENIFYACITKKGKLKVLVMQCPINSKFSALTGTCVTNNLTNNYNVNDTDDDEDDD